MVRIRRSGLMSREPGGRADCEGRVVVIVQDRHKTCFAARHFDTEIMLICWVSLVYFLGFSLAPHCAALSLTETE